MRCAILSAIAFAVAVSAFNDESSLIQDLLDPSRHPMGDLKDPEFVEDSSPMIAKQSPILTESVLAASGSYWKWEDKVHSKADGKHRLRQLWKHGKVLEKDWALISTAGSSHKSTRQHEKRSFHKRRSYNPNHQYKRRTRKGSEFVQAEAGRGGPQPGYYKVMTTGVHAGKSAAQPAGWGMAAWHAHGARRNHVSAWAAVHQGTHWPMIWKISRSRRTKGTYTIKTTKYGPKGGKMPAGWGLSAWHAHGAVRNKWSSRVAVHAGNYWLMDWKIQRSKRTRGAWTIKTWGGPKNGKQPRGWGLAAWQKHGGRRNHASSWLYVHAGNHWLMDWKLVRVYPRGNCNYRTCSSRHPRRRHSVGHKGSLKGCYNKCYRPYGRRNRHSVCAYVCKGRRHSARRWRHSKIKCRTTAAASNRAGVVYAKQPGGYTMVGGGINNHYRHFNKLSAFEESFPHGSNWRCDTGFGPGRVTCYARSCNMAGAHCITRSAYKHGSGIAQATLPRGYVMTSGGIFNHYRHWNKHAAFETSIPIGSNTWRCDMGLGSGRFNCYVRGCKPRRGTRLHCITRHSGVGNHHNVQCPGHYSMTGCGQNELRRQWNHLSGFEEIRPHGNGCVCDSGFGPGKNRCYARCCRNIVHRL